MVQAKLFHLGFVRVLDRVNRCSVTIELIIALYIFSDFYADGSEVAWTNISTLAFVIR